MKLADALWSFCRHVGDLGNVEADAYGNAVFTLYDTVMSLSGVNSIIGLAVVVWSF